MSVQQRTRKLPDGTTTQEDTYTIRFYWDGTRHSIATGCTTKKDAEEREREIKRELRAGRIPDLLEKLKKRADSTTGALLTAYGAAHCPDRDLQPRAGHSLEAEQTNLDTLAKWWSGKNPNHITLADCDEYWAWRKANVTRGTGHRTTELELNTLRNCLNWAVRARHIEHNPITKATRYRTQVTHCREKMPTSGDELHDIANAFLLHNVAGTLVPYGFAYLLEALTGLRSEEITLLRSDAKIQNGLDYEPGYQDEKYLYIRRVKNGINPKIRLDDPDRPHILTLLGTIRQWHTLRHPQSPWLIPANTGEQLSRKSLTKALEPICKTLKLPSRTSHGARAYYVTTRRAQGIEDGQIAFELGQSSGPDIVRDVYGEPPANWQGLTNTFTWTPNTAAKKPAWQNWLEQTGANIIHLQQATSP
jgi:site-specific recombinase XerD